MFLLILIGSAAGYVAWSLVCLEINYKRASAMGIPLVRIPIDPLNFLWQVVEPNLWPALDFLRLPLPASTLYMRRGWFFADKAESHVRYGPIWATVTPRGIHVQVSDPEANHAIFTRRGDFVRPYHTYQLLEVYGPCISTADNANWARHRKVLAAPFNENIMNFVWNESLRQTRQMIEYWTTSESTRSFIPSVAQDTRTLSLNVLAATGFRRSVDFQGSSSGAVETEAGTFSYRDALQIVLDNVILLMVVPPRYLTNSWLPKSLLRLGKAAADFKMHMVRMLDEETSSLNRGEKGAGGIMTSFVRALDAHNKDDGSRGPKGMSVEEIFGNIFVINFAGHDTTANTLAFTMLLLAAFPEVQEWVAEEVRVVTANLDNEQWEYATLFPELKRCRAVLLETLRLFPPIMNLPKISNEQPQTLTVEGRTVVVPPVTWIYPCIIAAQTNSQHWPDPLAWKPSRWIKGGEETQPETLITPAKATYFPWSDGPQNCPGVRFSQVEFVAVLACLLRKHRLQAQTLPGESGEKLRERIMGVVEDCDAQMLLRMKDPNRIRLDCVRAKES
ncbi:cytochrome P450 [Massariosphaeria phaeospora]|uniref:Cytochrome P450 n=1 Tax=Massariosphaeria phaeospora TaxID=100035 RepID=A0A7C8MJ87_9PLEO|nr:cytochrome P450 [Massariosphaeria phaeospora]